MIKNLKILMNTTYTFLMLSVSVILLPTNISALCIDDDIDLLSDCVCISGNCKNGKGEMKCIYNAAVAATFKLTFKNGKWEGTGEYEIPPGTKFRGNFRNGKAFGKGLYSYNDVDGSFIEEYDGDFKDNCPNGKGNWKGKHGSYSGEFKNGNFHGLGIFKYNSEKTLTGKFFFGWFCLEGDCKNGQGESIRPYKEIADKYKGGHKNFYKHGQGEYLSADFKWTGSFVNGSIEGAGIQTFPDGQKYVGSFNDGERVKGGKWYNPDGSLNIEKTDEIE